MQNTAAATSRTRDRSTRRQAGEEQRPGLNEIAPALCARYQARRGARRYENSGHRTELGRYPIVRERAEPGQTRRRDQGDCCENSHAEPDDLDSGMGRVLLIPKLPLIIKRKEGRALTGHLRQFLMNAAPCLHYPPGRRNLKMSPFGRGGCVARARRRAERWSPAEAHRRETAAQPRSW
jgi:hypothetical protein